jgi:hypothetical protein
MLVTSGAWAQAPQGWELTISGSEHIARNAPIAIPFEGSVEPGQKLVLQAGRGAGSYPATLRNGELTVVPEGAMPGSQGRYRLQARSNAHAPIVRVEKRADQEALDVIIFDKPFTTYHYSNDGVAAIAALDAKEPKDKAEADAIKAERAKHAKKPYLWPVYSEGGVPITRDWPMGDKELSADHPHHKSIWTAYGDVNGVDTWGEGRNSGSQRTDAVDFGSGDAYGWITAKNTWLTNDGKPVISEAREYRFYASKERARLMDVIVTFTADHGDAKFGDTKEGGILAYRIRDQITTKNNGTITLDKKVDDPWGQDSAWTDYAGPIDEFGVRGLAVFDHPDNMRHPSRWHIRDYGLNGANVFGLSYFVGEEANGDFTLKAGESVTFKYRVFIHTGEAEFAKVAERYQDYINPPKMTLSE